VTVRYDLPKAFTLVENELARGCPPGINGETVLLELLNAMIDRCANIERAGAGADAVNPSPRSAVGHATLTAGIAAWHWG
jgi:magnesium transporter